MGATCGSNVVASTSPSPTTPFATKRGAYASPNEFPCAIATFTSPGWKLPAGAFPGDEARITATLGICRPSESSARTTNRCAKGVPTTVIGAIAMFWSAAGRDDVTERLNVIVPVAAVDVAVMVKEPGAEVTSPGAGKRATPLPSLSTVYGPGAVLGTNALAGFGAEKVTSTPLHGAPLASWTKTAIGSVKKQYWQVDCCSAGW